MLITIIFEKEVESLHIDVSEDLSLNDLRAFIEAETDIPPSAQVLLHNDMLLLDGKSTLREIGIVNNEHILLKQNVSVYETSSGANQRLQRAGQPNGAAGTLTSVSQGQSRSSNPQTNSKAQLEDSTRQTAIKAQNDTIRPEISSRMMELIRQNQIEENLQLAYDISPESFVPVNLLYIRLKINGHETYALVDTGAQHTVLHPKLAERFGISNLIDRRFASMTVGVGTQHSEGRIHSVPVSLGELGIELPCSFIILDIHVGILFGLDLLRRHKCNVDLACDSLVIGGEKIKFLTDHEIEKNVLPLQFESKVSESKVSQKMKETGSLPTVKDDDVSLNSDNTGKQYGIKKNGEQSYAQETSISTITSLGFTRKEAIEALKLAKGDVDLAASSLF